MRSSLTACAVALTTLALTVGCCCPYFSFGESPQPEEDFEAIVWSPIPPGVTPIAADYENIGLGDGYRAVHFTVETARLMDRIIERHHLAPVTCTYAEPLYPLETWHTQPKPDEIECFAYTEYEAEAAEYRKVLYTNADHTEGLFKVIYF